MNKKAKRSLSSATEALLQTLNALQNGGLRDEEKPN